MDHHKDHSLLVLDLQGVHGHYFDFFQVIAIEPRKKPSYFPLYWMVNRDPYNGLL